MAHLTLFIYIDRASAVVEIPDLADDKAIKIGWIQTCSRMRFINTYGKEGV